jgi:hypothetical protein
MNIILERSESAFVSTRALADMEDALICDGGATSTLTRSLKNCALVKQKVVDIQTAHGATLMSTTHHCLKTYYIRDRLGKIRPSSFVVLAYVVPIPQAIRIGAMAPKTGAQLKPKYSRLNQMEL